MIVTTPNPEVISFSAEPEWLDDIVRQLQCETGDQDPPSVRDRRRGMARDILECGYIGPDGRVQLFFSTRAFASFKETVESMKEPRKGHEPGHFAAMAIRDD